MNECKPLAKGGDKEILHGITGGVNSGEVLAIMAGPRPRPPGYWRRCDQYSWHKTERTPTQNTRDRNPTCSSVNSRFLG